MTTICPSCAELVDSDDTYAVHVQRRGGWIEYSWTCPECAAPVNARELDPHNMAGASK